MTDPRREDESRNWVVGDLLQSIQGESMPAFIEEIAREVQTWLGSAISGDFLLESDEPGSVSERQLQVDLEYLFSRMEWVAPYADAIPAMRELSGHEDVVVFSVGSIILDDAFRMLVDHAALFARDTCKRVWLISDTWVIGDVALYTPHIYALRAQGIELHFILVTPWGWSAVPWEEPTERGQRLLWKNEKGRPPLGQNPSDAGYRPPQTEN